MAGSAVVIEFNNGTPVEVIHHGDGITFVTLGKHPDLYDEDGVPVELFSEYMPEMPKEISMAVVPAIRTERDRLN